MILKDVRKEIYDVVSKFFCQATILWGEQINTKPTVPYLTLKITQDSRSNFSHKEGDATITVHQVRLEINLYTGGRSLSNSKNATTNFENTAIDDMSEFLDYLRSDFTQLEIGKLGMAFELESDIKDLSFLENDTSYRYRAMAEFLVSYQDITGGAYSNRHLDENLDVIETSDTNPSGGGSKEMKETETGYTTQVIINESQEDDNEE